MRGFSSHRFDSLLNSDAERAALSVDFVEESVAKHFPCDKYVKKNLLITPHFPSVCQWKQKIIINLIEREFMKISLHETFLLLSTTGDSETRCFIPLPILTHDEEFTILWQLFCSFLSRFHVHKRLLHAARRVAKRTSFKATLQISHFGRAESEN